ncbi:phosphate signaling complex protein PhoU [Pengzhenrongella sp.]|jgi:phosphate transport system protein|uniref:phosphate signaling complex protein PhoU n=1 Tax=Pengzhenrongella sp. TaxID=2888820 RepID=UPI002F947755
MREIFEAELKQIGTDLADMSRLVEVAIANAGTALLTGDLKMAEAVIVADEAINTLERDLDTRCVHLLAQQAPVATDLRVIVSALRISATLERMGDLARHVAEFARRSYPKLALPQAVSGTFAEMHAAATRVAQRTTSLLETRDVDLATSIDHDDDMLDELHEDNFTAMLGGHWNGTPQQTIDTALLSRYFERFGDHAVSVARRIVYLVSGDFPEDNRPTR